MVVAGNGRRCLHDPLASRRITRQDQSVAAEPHSVPAANRTDGATVKDADPPFGGPAPGARVSLDLPEAGTCVALVTSKESQTLRLDLLDEVPEGELVMGSTLEIFVPRPDGIYHWLCSVKKLGPGQAEVELVSAPMFVQRRRAPRIGSQLRAQVRRPQARRTPSHDMTVADLSRGGMKLEGEFAVSTGDTLEVTVEIGPVLQVMGRVVLAYPLDAGRWAAHVCFLDGQREAIEVVDGYIARHLLEKLA